MRVIIYNWGKASDAGLCITSGMSSSKPKQVKIVEDQWQTCEVLFLNKIAIDDIINVVILFFSLRYIGQNDLSPFYNAYYATLFKYTHNFITIYSVLTLERCWT